MAKSILDLKCPFKMTIPIENYQLMNQSSTLKNKIKAKDNKTVKVQ